MKTTAIAFTVIFILGPVVIELLRSYFDSQRVRKRGFGGTLDISIIGMLVMVASGVLAALFWIIWYALA